MYPVFELFGKTIGVYGVCAVIGAAFAVVLSYLLIRGRDYLAEDAALVAVAIGIGCLIGGHLLYGITQWRTLAEMFGNITHLSWKEIWAYLQYCFGGQVFYGGLIGSCVGLLVYFQLPPARTLNKRKVLDVFAVVVPLFHCFGRIGCFFGGCCYGIESSFGFIVHNNIYNPAINDVRRFPTPLLEALCNLLLFVFLLIVFKKKAYQGKILYLYMVTYPVIRFCDEFLRGDEVRGFLGPLSTSQWISIALFVAGVVLLLVERKHTYTYEFHDNKIVN